MTLPDALLRGFARSHGIVRLSLFGSALRDDFDQDSDIDLLVEFAPSQVPGLFGLSAMERELESLVGRRVDLRTAGDLSRHFRDAVASSARLLYAA